MCSDQEIHQRSVIENISVSPFEKTNENILFDKLAIKAYERSAADKVMNDPKNIRTPEFLYKTVEYLRDCIADLDFLNPG